MAVVIPSLSERDLSNIWLPFEADPAVTLKLSSKLSVTEESLVSLQLLKHLLLFHLIVKNLGK